MEDLTKEQNLSKENCYKYNKNNTIFYKFEKMIELCIINK